MIFPFSEKNARKAKIPKNTCRQNSRESIGCEKNEPVTLSNLVLVVTLEISSDVNLMHLVTSVQHYGVFCYMFNINSVKCTRHFCYR